MECRPPAERPWLNPIAPTWVHGKRRAAAPAPLLPAGELEDRIYAAPGAEPTPHLTIHEQVA